MLRFVVELDISTLEETFGFVTPSVLRLACALAPLPYVQYPTLRACRRMVDSTKPAYLEAELCGSLLAEGCAADGFSLDRSFRLEALSLLRVQARSDSAAGSDLARLHTLHTRTTVSLSPLLAIETELAWDYILLNEDDLREQVDKRLRNVLYSATCEVPLRLGLLTWITGARVRLPSECIQGEAAWLLSQLCGWQGAESRPVPVPSEISAGGLIELFTDRLPTSVIGLKRTPGLLEFGPPSPERSVGLVVIDTEPVVILIRDPASNTGTHYTQRVVMNKGDVARVECSNGEIVLANLAGQTFTLARMIEKRSYEARMADRAINNAIAARNTERRLSGTVVKTIESGYVVYVPEIECTAFMLSPKQELFEGDTVTVIVDRVFPDRRWVSVQRLFDSKGLQRRERAALLHVPANAIPDSVTPGDVFAAKLFRHGTHIFGNRRSAHVFLDRGSPLGNISFGHKPGRLRFEKAVRLIDSVWLPPVGTLMEVLAAGVSNGEWELRLRTAAFTDAEDIENPLETSATTNATVVGVNWHGVDLEAPNGQLLWLPRLHCHPLPLKDHPIRLTAGQTIRVRLVGYSDRRAATVLASQRALAEAYLEKLENGRTVYGQIEHRLASGEYQIIVDPIVGVSNHPFRVASIGATERDFFSGDRISAKVDHFLRNRWLLVVSDVSKA